VYLAWHFSFVCAALSDSDSNDCWQEFVTQEEKGKEKPDELWRCNSDIHGIQWRTTCCIPHPITCPKTCTHLKWEVTHDWGTFCSL
jgi:hypothetical protein